LKDGEQHKEGYMDKALELILQLPAIVQTVIVLAVYSLIKGGYITSKFIVKKKKNIGSISDHSECKNFPSLVVMMKDAMYKSSKIQTIKREDTIYDQVNIFENIFEDIFKILKSNYLTLYKNEKSIPIDGILNHIEVKYYLSILRNSQKSLKQLTIKFMKENHFLAKSEAEFRSYIIERSEDYQQALSEYLDYEYDSQNFAVSREKLYKSNMKCMDKINNKLEEFFYKVRDVTISNQKEITALESEIKPFV